MEDHGYREHAVQMDDHGKQADAARFEDDGYREDLAYVHDAGFGLIAEAAAQVALGALAGPEAGPVVELGCGSGITAARLLAAGYEVHGCDVSAGQIALARERAPGASFEVGSFLEVELPQCQAIGAIGEVLGYAIDPANGHDRLGPTLARCHAALDPGGLLLFDLAGPGRGGPTGSTRNFAIGPDWAVLAAAHEHSDPPVLVREITTFREVEGAYRRGGETHRLVLHEPEATLALLESTGFDAEARPGYGDERLPGHTVYLARRRS